MIAVFAAMDAEVQPLLRAAVLRESSEASGFPVIRAEIGGREAIVCRTGLGRRAAAAAEAVLGSFSPKVVLSAGTAGGLSPDLNAGDIVICDRVRAADGASPEDAEPVLADAGSPARASRPGAAAHDRSVGLDGGGWRRLADGVARAAELARSRGFEPTFHHHTATYVEAPWEIERLLELTDVGLLLDTGHLTLGGGDPIQALDDWRERIDHVHVKDYRREILAAIVAERADMEEAWRRGVFCELGQGDVDLPGFFARLRTIGYEGWLVVEQDRIPAADERPGEAAEAQARNRRWLATTVGL